ncbi:Type III-B CRISPR module RAMP protein Cmr4 [Methylacidimicrobium sp. AP8]|uniref:type III-B CRISPR module RAMP protein Cmr4 n=1 Tax=Methylacidimicrobium sp. AP8 TaxID=2730359 RepID=UPI0018BFD3C6|nr:type III-B CRISPR module RAMP protein Cmr4 [Methylacidimicrobium sp. AP8]CAB4243740.1 Type III-B CRISPR module RAMP protein Cmr4 [Methylacidimicrobium sp. AP8]
MTNPSFQTYPTAALAVDPIHVGTGGTRLGRVDNAIVRDPVTKVPKIPGSSLAGVLRSYVAMRKQATEGNRRIDSREKPYFPDCAGQGQPRPDGSGGHCGQFTCPVCTVFGFARGERGGFAGLAAFSDAHVLLFPVATCEGPVWITAPLALRWLAGLQNVMDVREDAVNRAAAADKLNLGWLLLPVVEHGQMETVKEKLQAMGVPPYILERLGLVSDKLFPHVVNSNLEVRTSVAIDPATGAAEEGALFTYEALPRGTVLFWEVTCKSPHHFKINGENIAKVDSPDGVYKVVEEGFPYMEALGIGGMGTRGMGRLRVLKSEKPNARSASPEEK